MKRVLLKLVFVCVSRVMFADQLPKEREEQVSELQKEGYNLIDAIFAHAKASVEAHEDLMDGQWWNKHKEVTELQNILSDATIIFTFDEHADNPIPKKLATYVEHKINEEVPHIFAINEISVKRVENFYQFSHTMCKLTGGLHCGKMMRAVESEHFDEMLKLKLQKMAREQLRKEHAEQLREVLLFGGHR